MQATNTYKPHNGELNSLDSLRRNIENFATAINANARITEGRDNLSFAAGKGVLYAPADKAVGKWVCVVDTANTNDHWTMTPTDSGSSAADFFDVGVPAACQAVAANAKAARFMVGFTPDNAGTASITNPEAGAAATQIVFRNYSTATSGDYASYSASAGHHIFAPANGITRTVGTGTPDSIFAPVDVLLSGDGYWTTVWASGGQGNTFYCRLGASTYGTTLGDARLSFRLIGYWL